MGILLLSVGYAGTVAQHSMYSPHLHEETQHCVLLIDQVGESRRWLRRLVSDFSPRSPPFSPGPQEEGFIIDKVA